MLRVGLTGGIACGKSRVLRRLESLGCRTLDLDHVAHELMSPGQPAHADVVAAFGPGVLGPGGAIDRKALAALVFQDKAARERLNAIVHPRVRREERERMAALGREAEIVVSDAALLVEAGLHLRFDRLVVVHCSPAEQLRRLMARDALSRETALARIRAQMPIREKRRFAHLEVDTSGRPEDTDAAAEALLEELSAVAHAPVRPVVVARDVLAGLMSNAGASAEAQAAIRLLDEIIAANGIEMNRVAALIGRDTTSGWLAIPGDSSPLRPAALVAPVVAFCLARRGADPELIGLGAMSVARAVTAEASLVAEACASAWLMAQVGNGQRAAGAEAQSQAVEFGLRWGGARAERLIGIAPGEQGRSDPEATAAADRFLDAVRRWATAEG